MLPQERLGTALFNRMGRRVALSAAGEALAPVLIRAFDEMRQGFANLRADSGAVLTISCTNSVANLFLAPRIGRFQMERPELAVRIHTSDSLVDFARDNVDVAIRGGGGHWPGVEAIFLTHNRLVPLCSPDFLGRIGPIRTAADLLAVPRLSPDDIWWQQWFAAMGIDLAGAARPPALAFDSQVMEGRAAVAGQGVAIVNPFLWRGEIEAGLLVELVDSRFIEQMAYWIVCPPANRNQPKVKAFRDWVRAEFEAERASDPEGRFLPRC